MTYPSTGKAREQRKEAKVLSCFEGYASRNAIADFAAGMALIVVIPALAFWHIRTNVAGDISANWQIIAYLLLVVMGAIGYAIIRKYPAGIVSIRKDLDKMLTGNLADPDGTSLPPGMNDIAAVKRNISLIAERIEALAADLGKKNIAKSEAAGNLIKHESLVTMACGLAHDYNNILTAILGNASILKKNLSHGTETMESIENIENAISRALEINNQILVFSGRFPLNVDE